VFTVAGWKEDEDRAMKTAYKLYQKLVASEYPGVKDKAEKIASDLVLKNINVYEALGEFRSIFVPSEKEFSMEDGSTMEHLKERHGLIKLILKEGYHVTAPKVFIRRKG